MGSFTKYRNAVLKYSVIKTSQKTKKEHEELEKKFIAQALGETTTSTKASHPTKQEIFISKLYRGLIEVHTSLESLKAFEVYISRFPYSKTTISRSQYLRFIIESYLHEFYILKERTNAYLTTVVRAYRSDYRHSIYVSKTKPLFKAIPNIFDNLLKARGGHVHQSRYTDNDLDKLDALELYKTLGTDLDNVFYILSEDHYKEIRKKWKGIITSNNESVDKVCDLIFGVLYTIVCTKSGNIRHPRIKKPNDQ